MLPTPKNLRQEIPAAPGVYIFRNSTGNVIYVGKAKSLRKRLFSYFQPSRSRSADIKLRILIHSIADLDYFAVASEQEALVLESRLINEYKPRYNIELKDDKRFLLVAIDLHEKFPHLVITRLKRDDGRIYLGPFPHSRALRDMVHFLSIQYGIRTCQQKTVHQNELKCLHGTLRNCMAPCLDNVSPAEYSKRINRIMELLNGDHREITNKLSAIMKHYAASENFEQAAQYRDMIDNFKLLPPKMRTFQHHHLHAPARGNDVSLSLQALKDVLTMSRLPRTIECFDISNIGGCLATGSLVCFINGKSAPQKYRHYRIKTVEGSDDFAMIREVISRCYLRRQKAECSFPDLIIIDGGSGQLSAVLAGLKNCGQRSLFPSVIGLAKQDEAIYLQSKANPLHLPRHHPALKLLQAIRDEAHRFALTYHRLLRNKRMSESILDEIRGIGPRHRLELLKHFGSVKRMGESNPETIMAASPGISKTLAVRILTHLSHRIAVKR